MSGPSVPTSAQPARPQSAPRDVPGSVRAKAKEGRVSYDEVIGERPPPGLRIRTVQKPNGFEARIIFPMDKGAFFVFAFITVVLGVPVYLGLKNLDMILSGWGIMLGFGLLCLGFLFVLWMMIETLYGEDELILTDHDLIYGNRLSWRPGRASVHQSFPLSEISNVTVTGVKGRGIIPSARGKPAELSIATQNEAIILAPDIPKRTLNWLRDYVISWIVRT